LNENEEGVDWYIFGYGEDEAIVEAGGKEGSLGRRRKGEEGAKVTCLARDHLSEKEKQKKN